MKKPFPQKVFFAIIFIFLIGSCKKAEKSSVKTTDSKLSHGLGAILDHQAYLNIKHINLDQVKADLIKSGLLSNLILNSTPPPSVMLPRVPVGDQGSTGTCVSWSIGYTLMGILNTEFPVNNVTTATSPWYVYQKDHSASGDCSASDGMYVSNGMNIVTGSGVPSVNLDGTLGSPCTAPSSTVNSSASLNRVYNYGAISTLADVKAALSMHLPVEMGLNVYQSFFDAFTYGTTFNANSISGSVLGGHAVCVVGYDDTKNAILIENQWGTYGGDPQNPGCMWLDYNIFSSSAMGLQLYVASPNSTSPQAIYEFYNSSLGKHAYNLNYTMAGQYPGWAFNGQPFMVYAANVTNTVPIYQFYNSSTHDHVMRTNVNSLWGPAYVNQGILFYAYATNVPGSVPIYEFYTSDNGGDHFYSTDINAANPYPHWRYNTLPFYAIHN